MNASPLIHAAVTMRTPSERIHAETDRATALYKRSAHTHTHTHTHCGVVVAQFVLLKPGAFCWRDHSHRRRRRCMALLSSAHLRLAGGRAIDVAPSDASQSAPRTSFAAAIQRAAAAPRPSPPASTMSSTLLRHRSSAHNLSSRLYTQGEVTSQILRSRYDRHFVGIARYNASSYS